MNFRFPNSRYLLKTIYVSLLLMVVFSGISQSVQSNSDIGSYNGLSYSIDLIENSKIEDAELFIRKYISEKTSLKDKAHICYKIAVAYNNNLYYDLSLEYAFEGINYLDTNSFLLSELYQVVIINHLDLTNYDLAESYYWKTAQLHNKRKYVESNEFNLIGEIYRLKKDFKKAIVFYYKAIIMNKANGYDEPLAVNFNNIGLSYLYLNNIDSAVFYLSKSAQLIDSVQLANRKSTINISFGELYFIEGDFPKALSFFKKTITFDLSNHPDQYEVYQDAYKGMMNCYDSIGDYSNALKSYNKYKKYRTIILDSKQNTSVLQKQILSDRKVHFKEMNLIKSKLDLEIKYNILIIMVLVAVLFIVVLIVLILRVRNKKAKQKIELEMKRNIIQELELDKMKLSKEHLESELVQIKQNQKIKKLERIRLEEQIQSKNRELTSTALHLMSKNEILHHIQEKISQMNDKGVDVPTNVYKEIKFVIADSLRMDEDWQVFKRHFTDVHPLFFEKLKLNYPDLTTDELKLCAYLKIQLSSKEIARLINVTVAAVNKRRNRLRKKLQLSPNEDFDGFFLKALEL